MYKKWFRESSDLIIFILVALMSSKPAVGESIQINFTQFDTYSIDIAHIEVGDTVLWRPLSEGHNVEFLAGPEMDNLPPSSVMNESHSVTFNQSGIYLYGCTPHLNIGMLGLVVVDKDLRNIEKLYEVEMSGVAKSVLRKLIIKTKSQIKLK